MTKNYFSKYLLLLVLVFNISKSSGQENFVIEQYNHLWSQIDSCVNCKELNEALKYANKLVDFSEKNINDNFAVALVYGRIAQIYSSFNDDASILNGCKYYDKAFKKFILDDTSNSIEMALIELRALSAGYHQLCLYNKVIETINNNNIFLKSIDYNEWEQYILDILYWKASAYCKLDFTIPDSQKEAINIQKKRLEFVEKKIGINNKNYLGELLSLRMCYIYPNDTIQIDSIYNIAFNIFDKEPSLKNDITYPVFILNYIPYLYRTNNTILIPKYEAEMDRLSALESTPFATKINYHTLKIQYYYNRQEYNEADSICNIAISLIENIEKNKLVYLNENYAKLLCMKSEIQFNLRNFIDADEYANKAYSIVSTNGNENEINANIYKSIANIKYDLGDKKSAEEMLTKYIEIYEKMDFREVDPYAIILMMNIKNKEEVISFYENTIKKISNLENNASYGDILKNVARTYMDLKEYNKADSLLNIAENLILNNDNKWYDSDIRKNRSLSLLKVEKAKLLLIQRKYKEAEKELKKSIELSDDYDIQNNLTLLSLLYAYLNDEENFSKTNEKTFNYTKNDLINHFLFLGEHEREIFITDVLDYQLMGFEMFPSKMKTQQSREIAFNAALIHKGIALESSLIARANIPNFQELHNEYNNLINLRTRYTKADDYNTRNNLKQQISEIEKYLQKNITKNSSYIESLFTSWQQVQKNLEKDEIVVEMVKYPNIYTKFITEEPGFMYGALLLSKNTSAPIYVDICEEKDIVKLLNGKNEIYKDDNIELAYELIWKPLESHIKEYKRVLFSPVGLLNIINMEILGNAKDNNKDFIRLSSSRMLCKQKKSNTLKMATIYGSLNYEKRINISQIPNNNKASLYIKRAVEENKEIVPLNGTIKEVNEICDLLKLNNIPYVLYKDEEGTEESYKQLENELNISILHIATHGFSLGHRTIKDFDEPMRKCGLLMSGSQDAWLGKEVRIGEDGILLGEEIQNVKLRNNNLVVLSACETGLGAISSEGVLGLQRSFKKAGAGAILMSLWRVNDIATSIIMTQFYKNYISGESMHKSLKNAQQYVRDYKDEDGNKLFEDPYYWAGFILLDAIE